MHHSRRRKKQRPNYGRRTVEICRSSNGFGFTISGQKPCILSCIVPDSPADCAGLHAGDFLISVNGSNVSRLPHEVVVQLINDSIGTIRLTIAENYFSDSSDDETRDNLWSNSSHLTHGLRRPKFPHSKVKPNRASQPQNPMLNRKKVEMDAFDTLNTKITDGMLKATKFFDEAKTSVAYSIIPSPGARNAHDVRNVSAMVAPTPAVASTSTSTAADEQFQLEYRTVVGYLGTIEMPKQIATSSKLQTVRSCIRKMRQEKRQPTIVLMQILPNYLKLYNAENALIAKYPATRLSYVSSNHGAGGVIDGDMRFFGLVTSAVYSDGQILSDASKSSTSAQRTNDVIVSNSCHVFVVDLKLIDHSTHFERAEQFSIVCTKDPVTNCCLEFPSNSDYVVNLIRSMYALNAEMPSTASNAIENSRHARKAQSRQLAAARENQSPQPSNHSEITTTSSNSDSGIGFHNDFANISDRIVVVDFPRDGRPFNQPTMALSNERNAHHRLSSRPMPFGVDSIRNIRSKCDFAAAMTATTSMATVHHAKSKSLDSTATAANVPNAKENYQPDARNRMSDLNLIRAMPDPKPLKSLSTSVEYETIYPHEDSSEMKSFVSADEVEQPTRVSRRATRRSSLLQASRSCDDIAMTPKHRYCPTNDVAANLIASMDDVSLLGEAPPPPTRQQMHPADDDYVFLAPPIPKAKRRSKKPISLTPKKPDNGSSAQSYKLSPKVFGLPLMPKSNAVKKSQSKRRLSMSSDTERTDEAANDSSKCKMFNVWGSLQDFEALNKMPTTSRSGGSSMECLEAAFSEPDLTVSCCFFIFIAFTTI